MKTQDTTSFRNSVAILLATIGLIVASAITAQAQTQYTTPDTICGSAQDVVYGVQNPTASSTYTWWLGTPGFGTIDNSVTPNSQVIQIDWSGTMGTTVLYVQETTAEGCVGDTVSLPITLYPQPTLAVAGDTVCPGNDATVTLTLTGTAPWIVTYTTDGGVTNQNLTVMTSPYYITYPGTGNPFNFQVLGVTDTYCNADLAALPAAVVVNILPAPTSGPIFHY
jgi:hypothetical protein